MEDFSSFATEDTTASKPDFSGQAHSLDFSGQALPMPEAGGVWNKHGGASGSWANGASATYEPYQALQLAPNPETNPVDAVINKTMQVGGKVISAGVSVYDMMAGFPAALLKTIPQTGKIIGLLAAGDPEALKNSLEEINQSIADHPAYAAALNPLKTALEISGNKLPTSPVDEALGRGMGKVQSGSESLAKSTNTPSLAYAIPALTEQLINLFAVHAMVGGKAAPAHADIKATVEEAAKTVPEGAPISQQAEAILRAAAKYNIDTKDIPQAHVEAVIAKAGEKPAVPAESPIVQQADIQAPEVGAAGQAPKVSSAEGTGILDAVVQGMRRNVGDRRIEDRGTLQGLTEDRRVSAAMQRRTASVPEVAPPSQPMAIPKQAVGQQSALGDLGGTHAATQEAFANDMQKQMVYLGDIAHAKGYESVDAFATARPEEFTNVAHEWRTKHSSDVTPEAVAEFSKQRNKLAHEQLKQEVLQRGGFFHQRGAVGDLQSGIAKAQTEQDLQVHRLQDKNGGLREDAITDYLKGERVSDAEYQKHLSEHNYFNKPLGGKSFFGQRGAVDPKLIAATGLSIAGALAGMYLKPDQKMEGLIGGALFGFGLAALPRMSSVITQNWKAALQEGNGKAGGIKVAKHVATGAGFAAGGALLSDPEHPVEGALLGSVLFGLRFLPKKGAHPEEQLAHAYNGNRAAEDRLILQREAAMKEAVPDKAAREYLAEAAEKPGAVWRNEKERLVIEAHRGIVNNSYAAMQQFPRIKVGFIENYVSHILEANGLPQSELGRIVGELMGTGKGTGTGSRFTKERTYPTFADLRAATGDALKIKTMDIAEIDKIYQRSVNRTIEQHRLVEGLINAIDHQGKPAEWIVDKPAMGYTPANATMLRGKYVRDDIKDSLNFVFDVKNHGAPAEALFALNRATKRVNVFGTFFHGGSLLTSYALAGGGINIFKYKGNIDAAVALWKNGGLGDRLDRGIRNGFRVPTPDEASIGAIQAGGQMADEVINKLLGTDTRRLGKIAGGLEDFQKKTFDKATWDYIGVGTKVSTFMRLMEEFDLEKDANGKHMGMDEDQYMQAVSSHVNKSFGGLDWYTVATEAKTEAGRKMAMWMLKPSPRDWLGVAAFAPDWGVATFRAMADALPGGSTNPVSTMLARRYVIRTAVIYATFLNTANYALSGHFMWDNPQHGVDSLRLDIGNGTSVQFLKHAMEYGEWINHPTKTFANKMGFFPQAANVIMNGTQYPSGPPIEGSKLEEIAKRTLPFTTRSFAGEPDVTEGLTRSLLSVVSINIYGHTEEQKAILSDQRAERKAAKQGDK